MYYGEKVMLRAYKREDIPFACEYMNDSEVKGHLAIGVPFPMTFDQELRWYESLTAAKDNYNFAIEDLETGEYIGGCGINDTNWLSRVATVGIFIGDKNYWNKGYGTDAMKVLMKFVFEQMNMNKIKLFVFGFNKRAQKCYEKCGFKLEGVMRQELFRDGKYYDEYAMGILREEWETKQER